MKITIRKSEDPWVRCLDCGRKIHHKKVPKSSESSHDAWDKDEPHLCNICEHLRIQKQYVGG